MSKIDEYIKRGMAFLEGESVARDYEQAFYWLNAAYELGSDKAGATLRNMREKSLGVPFDGDETEGGGDPCEAASQGDFLTASGVAGTIEDAILVNADMAGYRLANPNRCVACGEEALVPSEAFEGAKHCAPSKGGCGTNLMIPIAENGLDRGFALQPYREPVLGCQESTYSSLGALVHMIKYDTRVDDALKTDMLKEIARRIVECGIIEQVINESVGRNVVVVPAPSSKKRKIQPVYVLAELISEGRFGFEAALKKRSSVESKSRPKGTELAANDVSCSGSVCGKAILLIDDTYGEGATLRACIRALRGSGAREVYYLSLCKNIFGGVKGSLADDDDIY